MALTDEYSMWLMTGLHSEKFKKNLVDNINKFLKYDDNVKILVVLQNGIDLKTSSRIHTIKSNAGIIEYLSSGLDYLRNNSYKGEWFARFDSDDWYSEKYLENINIAKKEKFSIWSYIPSPYVKVQKKLIYCKSLSPNKPSGLGGTLASRIDCAVDFKDLTSTIFGSDNTWCKEMHQNGHEAVTRGPEGFALLRHDEHEHVFPVSAESLIHAWPCNAYDQKSLDIDAEPNTDFLIKNNPELAMQGIKKMRANLAHRSNRNI